MNHLGLLAPLLLLGACTSVPTEDSPVTEMGAGECRNEPLSQFVGQQATEQVGAEIQRLSGAKLFQWITPGMAVTMDFRSDRVRVTVDAAGKIENARCG